MSKSQHINKRLLNRVKDDRKLCACAFVFTVCFFVLIWNLLVFVGKYIG